MIALKRAYEPAARDDGWRVLVERLWPRGVTKDRLAADAWLKELAPSAELRAWYGHDAGKRREFERRYRAELKAPAARAPLGELRARAAAGRVTLLFATHDVALSSAAVLRDVLMAKRRPTEKPAKPAPAKTKPKPAKAKRASAKPSKAKRASAKPSKAKRATKTKRATRGQRATKPAASRRAR